MPQPSSGAALPFWSVKPRSSEPGPSPETNLTTELTRPPSMVVADEPPELTTAIALPMKLMFST